MFYVPILVYKENECVHGERGEGGLDTKTFTVVFSRLVSLRLIFFFSQKTNVLREYRITWGPCDRKHTTLGVSMGHKHHSVAFGGPEPGAGAVSSGVTVRGP